MILQRSIVGVANLRCLHDMARDPQTQSRGRPRFEANRHTYQLNLYYFSPSVLHGHPHVVSRCIADAGDLRVIRIDRDSALRNSNSTEDECWQDMDIATATNLFTASPQDRRKGKWKHWCLGVLVSWHVNKTEGNVSVRKTILVMMISGMCTAVR